jgi:TIR domain
MKYDVFLCYNTKNKSDAKFLCELLRRSNFRVFFDESEILPGQDWQARLESGLRQSAAIIVLVRSGGLGPWQDLENRAYQMISVKNDRPIIPVLLPGAEATFRSDHTPAWLQLKSYVAFAPAAATRRAGCLESGHNGPNGPKSPFGILGIPVI